MAKKRKQKTKRSTSEIHARRPEEMDLACLEMDPMDFLPPPRDVKPLGSDRPYLIASYSNSLRETVHQFQEQQMYYSYVHRPEMAYKQAIKPPTPSRSKVNGVRRRKHRSIKPALTGPYPLQAEEDSEPDVPTRNPTRFDTSVEGARWRRATTTGSLPPGLDSPPPVVAQAPSFKAQPLEKQYSVDTAKFKIMCEAARAEK